ARPAWRCWSIPPTRAPPRPIRERLKPLLALWDCKSRSLTPAPAARSMRPSRALGASGPMCCSSAGTGFFTADTSKSSIWRRICCGTFRLRCCPDATLPANREGRPAIPHAGRSSVIFCDLDGRTRKLHRGIIMRHIAIAMIATTALFGLAQNAFAADTRALPGPYGPPSPVYAPPPFSWTGFYVGANIGGAWAHRDGADTFLGGDFGGGNNRGVVIGGGQLGYNWQIGYAVLGIQGDFAGAANNHKPLTVFIPSVGTIQVTSNNRWITTVAGRFGVTNGPWLFYGKAGGGWVGNEDFTITNLTTGASITASNNKNSGWLVGAGIEWAFAPNWSAKVEYNF